MSFQLYPPLDTVAYDEGGHVVTPLGISVPVFTQFYCAAVVARRLLTANPIAVVGTALPISTPLAFATVNVKDFGALGDGDEALFEYVAQTCDPATDYQVLPIIDPWRLQTRDGIALNSAIKYLRSIGGGTLYIPKGEYRVYCNLETINFDCKIVGDGVGQTILKNCDASPTDQHVFGILHIFPYSSTAGGGYQSAGGVFPAKKITIADITLDGNADVRAEAPSEFSTQTLRVEGAAQCTMQNVHAFNSPLDSLIVQVWADRLDCWARADSCVFGKCWRNSVSLISGNNIVFSNCIFEDAGSIHNGQSPASCLDMEPDNEAQRGRNVKFMGCTFRNGQNQAAIAQYFDGITFQGCNFQQSSNAGSAEYLVTTHGGQTEFIGCVFDGVGAASNKRPYVWVYPSVVVGAYKRLQFAKFSDCRFLNVGMLSDSGIYGDTSIIGCDFKNSTCPILVTSGRSLTVKTTTLTNVIDANNFGQGMVAAFGVAPGFAGDLDIDGLTVKFDPTQLPLSGSLALVNTVFATGVYINPTLASTSFGRVQNVYVCGFFRKYPATFGYAITPANFVDWRGGSTAPADTVGGPAPGAVWYRNCTQYGDFA